MSKEAIVGIDPGLEGGLAARAKSWVVVDTMPVTADGTLDVNELVAWLRWHADQVEVFLVEKPVVFRFQRPQDCAKQWRMFGQILGVLAALGLPHEIVEARKWSAEFEHGVEEVEKHKRYAAIKKARRAIATRLFPKVDLRDGPRSKVPHEGKVDALLLAEFGYRRRHGGRS